MTNATTQQSERGPFEPSVFDSWIRRDLTTRFAGALREPLPAAFMAILDMAADVKPLNC